MIYNGDALARVKADPQIATNFRQR
jgi:hypothetical protein